MWHKLQWNPINFTEISPHVEKFTISPQLSYKESWNFSTWQFFLHGYKPWCPWQIWALTKTTSIRRQTSSCVETKLWGGGDQSVFETITTPLLVTWHSFGRSYWDFLCRLRLAKCLIKAIKSLYYIISKSIQGIFLLFSPFKIHQNDYDSDSHYLHSGQKNVMEGFISAR